MLAKDKKFYELISNYEIWSKESARTTKWIYEYNETLNYFQLNINFLSTKEINELSKKCGHLKAMIEKYAKYLK